jgi:hypothetical protein
VRVSQGGGDIGISDLESSQRSREGEFVLVESAARATNVLVVLLNASSKDDCKIPRHQWNRRQGRGNVQVSCLSWRLRQECRERSWRRAFADIATLRMKDEEVVVVRDSSP